MYLKIITLSFDRIIKTKGSLGPQWIVGTAVG